MISAALKALGDVLSPEFRSILWKALGLTLVLFIAVLVGVEFLISALTIFSWAWGDTLLAIGAGLLLLVSFFFLMPVTMAIFAGLFLDDVAARVERLHYPAHPPGVPLGAARAVSTALQFAAVVLLVNLAVLPMVFFAFGAFVLVAANAYLLSREYFEMAAMRHMGVGDARALRRANTPGVFAAGFIPALLSLVPFLNIAVPLFATSYFVHIFKQVKASSP